MISISCIFVAALMVSVATRVFDDLESAEKNPGQALRELKKECQMYLLQDDQDGLRMSLVMSNIRQAIEHNSKNFGWEMGLSCFSIMKQEERSKVILEKLPDHSNMTYRGRDRLQERDFISVTSAYTSTQPVTALCLNVPCQIDWRNVSGRSYVSAIKDQGSCGSCWAHAAAAALESRLMIMNRVPRSVIPDVSEEQAVRCTYGSYDGCDGGRGRDALHYAWFWYYGANNETQYRYTGTWGKCSANAYKFDASTSYRYIVYYWSSYQIDNRNEIKRALALGPVMAAMNSNSAFSSYRSGIFRCSLSDRSTINHEVLIIGYRDPAPGSNEDGYWIVKNSWGTTWGESGYARVSMVLNYDCGFAKWEFVSAIMTEDKVTSTSVIASSPTSTSNSNFTDQRRLSVSYSYSYSDDAISISLGVLSAAAVIAMIMYYKRYRKVSQIQK